MKVALAAVLSLLTVVWAEQDTSVQKVVELLEELKANVEGEGKDEAKTYDEAANFCKDMTDTKSTAIKGGRNTIESNSGEVAVETAEREKKSDELADRKQKHEIVTANLIEAKATHAQEEAAFVLESADLKKAVTALGKAIDSMNDGRAGSGSLLETSAKARDSVKRSLELAEMMGLLHGSKQKVIGAFLQSAVDPADPTYEYHSNEVVNILENLNKEFGQKLKVLQEEWAKTSENNLKMIKDYEDDLQNNDEAMSELSQRLSTLSESIAGRKEDIIHAQAILKDDQAYMKDLTMKCEKRATEWDQRAQLRSEELEALEGALDALRNGAVEPLTETGLVQIQRHRPVASFLQEGSITSLMQPRSSLRGSQVAEPVAQDKVSKAISFLAQAGNNLASYSLSTLAIRASDDPFLKVKALIQSLIERLLKEATQEATKKGACDTWVGKAKKERDYRKAEMEKLAVEIDSLNITEETLRKEVEELSDEMVSLHERLDESTNIRKEEKTENLKAIETAKKGQAAVKLALQILKEFYAKGSRARVLLQASPVDEDDKEGVLGSLGAYKGRQTRSTGIIGMLEVIKSDFERVEKTTLEAEKKAAADYIEFDRTSKSDIKGKDTKSTLNTEDADTAAIALKQKQADLEAATALHQSAIDRIEDLRPTCIDNKMSYEDRKAKREEEIEALKRALGILGEEGDK